MDPLLLSSEAASWKAPLLSFLKHLAPGLPQPFSHLRMTTVFTRLSASRLRSMKTTAGLHQLRALGAWQGVDTEGVVAGVITAPSHCHINGSDNQL